MITQNDVNQHNIRVAWTNIEFRNMVCIFTYNLKVVLKQRSRECFLDIWSENVKLCSYRCDDQPTYLALQ